MAKDKKIPYLDEYILDSAERRRRHIGGAANKLNYWRKILSVPTNVPPTKEEKPKK